MPTVHNKKIISIEKSGKIFFSRIPYLPLIGIVKAIMAGNAQYILYMNTKTNSTDGASNPEPAKGTMLTKLGLGFATDEFKNQKRFQMNWNFYNDELTKENKLRFAV